MTIKNPVESGHPPGVVPVPADARSGPDRADGPLDPALRAVAVGSAMLGASAATQGMMVAFFATDPAPGAEDIAGLAGVGRFFYRRDHDLPIYLVGCVAAAAIIAAMARWRTSRALRGDPDRAAAVLFSDAGRLTIAAMIVVDLGLFGLAFHGTPYLFRALSARTAALLLGPSALALAFGFFGPSRASSRWPVRLGRVLSGGSTPALQGRAGRTADRLLMLASAALIVVVLYVPDWRTLAGRSVTGDILPFHHWDFFVMGPALGYLHGGALGTSVYSQYGVGWPMLLAWSTKLAPISYGHLFLFATRFSIVYFLAMLGGLRWVTGRASWAAAGTVLAINALLFEGYELTSTIWIHPASSILRAPTDILVFLAIWRHSRTGRAVWAGVAGAAVGLGVVFTTDTGLYLAAALAVYLVGVGRARTATIAGLAALLPALVGLAVASRGTILQADFWSGWLEAPRIYVGGMSALPIARSGRAATVLFSLLAAGQLVPIGMLAAAMVGRRATPGLAALAAMASYGLLVAMIFVNRSHPFNLSHACGPACVLLVVAASRLTGTTTGGIARLAPRAVLAVALLILGTNPRFRVFPSILREVAHGPEIRGESWSEDVRGLTPGERGLATDLAEVARAMADLRARGRSVAVLDPSDTMYYLASGVPPVDRYCPPIAGFVWTDQIDRRVARLRAHETDFLFMKEPASWREDSWVDAMDRLSDAVAERYERAGHAGSFTLWRRRENGGTGGETAR